MKKLGLIFVLIAALVLVACNDSDKTLVQPISANGSGAATDQAVTPQNVAVEFNDREYNEIRVIEIPTFVGTSAEIDAMNSVITAATDEFNEKTPEGGAVQITSNPVTTDKYIQVVTQYLSHQSDDYVGDIVSINYSVSNDTYITLDDALSEDGTDTDTVLNTALSLYLSQPNAGNVSDSEIVGFFILETANTDVFSYYIKLYTAGSEGGTTTSLYSYTVGSDQLTPVDLQMIVDPFSVDKYDPELIANKIANELASNGSDPGDTGNTITLIANFTSGAYSPDRVFEYEVGYTGDLSVVTIAEALSELTGFHFSINSIKMDGDSAYVDWSIASTLLAGIGSIEFKENFFFYDNVSLNWFMLDSLNDSIINNLPVSTVYYTMDGGKDLVVPEMPALAVFDANTPYLASSFYYSHGTESEPVDFSITKGTWRLDGDKATAYFEMDGNGSLEAYYASGSHEYSAYLEQGYGGLSGYTVFNVYNLEGELISDLYFDSSDYFYLNDPNGGKTFIKS